MFSPKAIPARDKTPFLVRSSERTEGLEPRIFLDDTSDDPSDDPSDEPKDAAPRENLAPPEDIRATTDLLIKGLMDRLPKPNSTWSLDDRARWLQTAASIFGLIYEPRDGEQREIAIAVAKDGPASERRDR